MDELRLDGMRSAADGVVKSLLAQGDDALAGRGDAASWLLAARDADDGLAGR